MVPFVERSRDTMEHGVLHERETCAEPAPSDVRAQLERILRSTEFRASPRRGEFLRYVVQEALAGRSDRLKGVAIAISVFGRDETFDQQADPVVRLEARRLRRDLDGYYATAGRNDAVRVSIPKGSYQPTFEWQETASRNSSPDLPSPEPISRASESKRLDRGTRSRFWVVVGALGLVIAAALVWQGARLFGSSASPTTAAEDHALAMPAGPRIAVLPFLNLSGDPGKQYFSDGITEQLIMELARFRDFMILPLGTTRGYSSASTDPREIGRNLGIDYVLEGSVRAVEQTLRISARLIDAREATHLWVQTYESALTPENIFEIQDTISKKVAGTIAGKYGILAHSGMARSKRKSPESLRSYDCVLRFYDYQISINPERHKDIRACLENAVEADPGYSEAAAVLATVYMHEKRFGFNPRDPSVNPSVRAVKLAKRAISLDPTNPTGHLVLATLHFSDGDLRGFKEAGERAIGLNPNNSDFLAHYGMRLAFIGEWDRGLALLRKAIALNPAHPHWYRFPFVLFDYRRGDYESALLEADKIEMPKFFWLPLVRAMILGRMGRSDEAQQAAQDLLALKPDFQREGMALIRIWQFRDDMVEKMVAGLRKGGVELRVEDARTATRGSLPPP